MTSTMTMADAIGRGVRQQVLQISSLNWSVEDRVPCGVFGNVSMRFVSSQAESRLDGRKEVGESAPILDRASVLRWSWSFQEARSFHSRSISQLAAPKRNNNKRLFLVDALALDFGRTIIDGAQRKATLGNGSLSSDSVDQGISSPKSLETKSWKKNAEPQQNGQSSDSWSSVPGGRPPLTADEEAEFALHVQDLLALETRRDELEKQLGRAPTHQEWADYVGISVFLLYARQGRGRAAKRKMVESNIMLVHSIAHQFHGRGLSHDDLCQQGVIGLLKSTEKFDSTRNTKFSSYAFFGVQNQMRIAAEKFGHALRIGQTVYANVSSLLRQKENFAVEHGRQPTCDELVEVSKMSAKKIRKLFQVMSPVKSLDASEANSSESNSASSLQLKDHTPASHPWLRARDEEQKAEVIRALASLTPHQQHIMHLRYGLGGQPPLSRAEVALVLGVSSTAVLTSEKRALGRLRELALEEGFLNYLNDSFWLR